MEQYIQHLTFADAALLVSGALLFVVAACVMWGRSGLAEDGARSRFTFPGVGKVSEPTRLLAGCYGLFLAYHLVVWALPPGATTFRVPESRWWLVVVVGTVSVLISLGLDRRESGGDRE